jgi:hypothetical protein
MMIYVSEVSGFSKSVLDDRNTLILSQIEANAPNKERYSLIAKVVNVGVALLVYGRDEGVARTACDVQTQWTGTGPCYMGNKGAVGVRFRVPGDEGDIGETFTCVLRISWLVIRLFVNQLRLCSSHRLRGQTSTQTSGLQAYCRHSLIFSHFPRLENT